MRRPDLRFGVVINRAVFVESLVADYCRQEQIPVLKGIPEDIRRIWHNIEARRSSLQASVVMQV